VFALGTLVRHSVYVPVRLTMSSAEKKPVQGSRFLLVSSLECFDAEEEGRCIANIRVNKFQQSKKDVGGRNTRAAGQNEADPTPPRTIFPFAFFVSSPAQLSTRGATTIPHRICINQLQSCRSQYLHASVQ
jgi:hypothetical protein